MSARSRLRARGSIASNGLIDDCGKLVREGAAANSWFDLSTLKEPYRIEGKKTMAWSLPSNSAGCCPT